MSTSKRSILVTGGTGIIGRHAIAELVALGHYVTTIGRASMSPTLASEAKYLQSDLLNSEPGSLLADMEHDTLLHLAWTTEHGKFWTAADNLDWLAASLHLIRAFAERGGKRIVVAGTCVEYEAPNSGPCIAGETPLKPVHLYSVTKDALRRTIKQYAADYGLELAWGRVFLVTGEGENTSRFVPSIITSLARGEEAKCSSGNQIRDLMDTRDCGAAFAHLAVSTFCGEANMSTNEPVTLGDVANMIGSLMGREKLIKLGSLPDRAGEPSNLWGETSVLDQLPDYQQKHDLGQTLQAGIDRWGKL